MANLVPQLYRMLPGPASLLLKQSCEMAPGVPWTNQIIDDIIADLNKQGYFYLPCLRFSPPNKGISDITVYLNKIETRKKGQVETKVSAEVLYSSEKTTHSDVEKASFPIDREGIKNAIEFLQKTVQNIKRRGLCDTCLAMERPKKRLRVGDSGYCTQCLLAKAIQ